MNPVRASAADWCKSLPRSIDYVGVDLGTVDRLADVRDLTAALDGVLLVVASPETAAESIRAAQAALAPCRLLGLVQNCPDEHRLHETPPDGN